MLTVIVLCSLGLQGCKKGAMIAGLSAAPAVMASYVLITEGGPRPLQRADLKPISQGLSPVLISNDGRIVEFDFLVGGPLRFSVAKREIGASSAGTPDVQPPRMEAPGLTVTDWRNTTNPKLNGEPIPDLSGTARSLAIAPDNQHFLLGTSSHLYYFDKKRALLWRVVVPGARSVNISNEGKLAVATLEDGTVRWYRLNDGKELLALFVQNDGKQWILWNQEGFFDASPGAEALIGYPLKEKAGEAPDAVTVKQLFEHFYRPDIVARHLEGDEPAVRRALQQTGDVGSLVAGGFPPRLGLAGPSKVALSNREFQLELQVSDRGGGIGRPTYRVDGVNHAPAARGGRTNGELSQAFTLPPGRHTIEASVSNSKGTVQSESVTVDIDVTAPEVQMPALHVLAVGIDEYRDHDYRLKFAVNDAEKIFKMLADRGYRYRRGNMELLTNGNATLENVGSAFERVASGMAPSDVFVAYFSGHGRALDGRFHFLPQEFIYTNDDELRTKSLTEDRLRKLLESIPANKSLVILDSCQSGVALNLAVTGRAIEEKAAIARLMRLTGRGVMAASSGSKVALEGYQNHGVFTYAFLQGLDGKADNGDGEITINEISDYVQKTVPILTMEKWHREQFPMHSIVGESFPLAWTNGKPVFQPPPRGAPAGRIGGGTRGPGDKAPAL